MVRHKNRYFVLEINQSYATKDTPLTLKSNSLYKALQDAVSSLHGDFGIAAIRSGFVTKYCNENTRIGIIRARHGPHKLIASSLPFITSIEKIDVYVTILYTGATIKQCLNFLIMHQQRRLDEFCLTLRTNEEKLALKEQMMNFENMMDIS